jgi:tRNA(Phe) wybutosine-synthesizing methylase Tyw3
VKILQSYRRCNEQNIEEGLWVFVSHEPESRMDWIEYLESWIYQLQFQLSCLHLRAEVKIEKHSIQFLNVESKPNSIQTG